MQPGEWPEGGRTPTHPESSSCPACTSAQTLEVSAFLQMLPCPSCASASDQAHSVFVCVQDAHTACTPGWVAASGVCAGASGAGCVSLSPLLSWGNSHLLCPWYARTSGRWAGCLRCSWMGERGQGPAGKTGSVQAGLRGNRCMSPELLVCASVTCVFTGTLSPWVWV